MIKKSINIKILFLACGFFSGFIVPFSMKAAGLLQDKLQKNQQTEFYKSTRGIRTEAETQKPKSKVRGYNYHLNENTNDNQHPDQVTDKVIDKYNQAIQYENKRDFRKAFENFKIAAQGNHPKALFSLATYYEMGIGTEKSLDKAIDCLLKVIELENDNTEAMYRLGQYFEQGGEQIERNMAKAVDYYVAAYEGGHLLAGKKIKQINVENSIENQNDKNYILVKIIQTDNPNFKFQYANLIKNQTNVSDKYVFYLKEAANQNHSGAILSLGNYYYQNHMLAELRSLFEQYQAQKNAADAQWLREMTILQHSTLALTYEQAETRSVDKALWHWQKAAELGSEEAKNRLQDLQEERTLLTAGSGYRVACAFTLDDKATTLKDYFEKAEALFDKNQKGSLEQNQQAYLYYQKVSPTQNPLVLKRMGELHFYKLISQASDNEAIRFLESYLEHKADDGETYYLLGKIYQNRAYSERAKMHFEKAKSLGFEPQQR
ncbi:tetratricopeptide repeat protein [Hugenholtzia roseola]|uniref:tetratricopeptide repeat protein n=1 Tax=Hugenholtzia roseola TaxID=1002 RepID=UPI00042850B5|nr:SEL1-like repeat protein [Hugenholtzia roseola]